MTNDPDIDKISKWLKQLPKVEPSADFDKKFWARFDGLKPGGGNRIAGLLSKQSASFLIMGVAAMALVGVMLTSLDRPAMTVVFGQVIKVSEDRKTEMIFSGQALAKGDTLKTGPNSWAVVEVENGYKLKLNPGTELRIDQLKPAYLPGKALFHLAKGEVLVGIEHGPGKSYPLEVLTENAYASAKGTQFRVISPTLVNPQTRVDVLAGAVEVGRTIHFAKDPNTFVMVKGGEQIYVKPHEDKLTPSQLAAKVKSDLNEQLQFSEDNRAILLIGMGKGRIDDLMKPCAMYLSFARKDKSAGTVEKAVQRIQKASERGNMRELTSALDELEQAVGSVKQISTPPIYLFLGAYHAHLNNDAKAAQMFRRVSLAQEAHSLASLALMAEARIYSDVPSQSDRLVEVLKRIVMSYPDSLEAPEARSKLQALGIPA